MMFTLFVLKNFGFFKIVFIWLTIISVRCVHITTFKATDKVFDVPFEGNKPLNIIHCQHPPYSHNTHQIFVCKVTILSNIKNSFYVSD